MSYGAVRKLVSPFKYPLKDIFCSKRWAIQMVR